MITKDRRAPRDKRHLRLRRWVRGSAQRPRLAVFRSLGHIYAQLVDDATGRTLLAVDSRSKDFIGTHKTGGNVAAAKAVGELLAQRAGGLVF
jgi:large subunit ribosomal protein L18